MREFYNVVIFVFTKEKQTYTISSFYRIRPLKILTVRRMCKLSLEHSAQSHVVTWSAKRSLSFLLLPKIPELNVRKFPEANGKHFLEFPETWQRRQRRKSWHHFSRLESYGIFGWITSAHSQCASSMTNCQDVKEAISSDLHINFELCSRRFVYLLGRGIYSEQIYRESSRISLVHKQYTVVRTEKYQCSPLPS